jgi:hypothetical protein
VSQHNPDTAVYEKTIQDLRSKLEQYTKLVADYMAHDDQQARDRFLWPACPCPRCHVARALLGAN